MNRGITHYENLAAFGPQLPEREPESIDQKIAASRELLNKYVASWDLISDITAEEFVNGEVPRLTEFDRRHLPDGTLLVALPQEIIDKVMAESSYDRRTWNMPAAFLRRLLVSHQDFVPPVPGNSQVMDRAIKEKRVLSFSDIRVESPEPIGARHSRTSTHEELNEHNIMGMARIPFALGSVPDVGSVLGYVTMAQANGMAFIARDKILSDIDQQVVVVEKVISALQNVELPNDMMPDATELQEFWDIMSLPGDQFKPQNALRRYVEELRASWIANVGAAIEASPRGIERKKRLYEAGCRLFRVYSPEGSLEIIDQTDRLKSSEQDPSVKYLAGQMMHLSTSIDAEKAGADGVITGTGGGSQCTTSKSTGIPVNTPNLLYQLRGELKIPIGIEGGGVGSNMMQAFALGASFLLKPGEIGMSLEGAGARFMFQDPEGNYLMLYGGEASDASKWWRDLVDPLGRPLFVEGESAVRRLAPNRYSMTQNINELKHDAANALVFQRKQTIAEVHSQDCSNIVEVTAGAGQLSGAYGQ